MPGNCFHICTLGNEIATKYVFMSNLLYILDFELVYKRSTIMLLIV